MKMLNAQYGAPRLRSLSAAVVLAPIAAAHGTGLSAGRSTDALSTDALFPDVTGLPPRGAPV